MSTKQKGIQGIQGNKQETNEVMDNNLRENTCCGNDSCQSLIPEHNKYFWCIMALLDETWRVLCEVWEYLAQISENCIGEGCNNMQ